MIFLSFMNLFRNYRRTLAILLTVALGTGVLFSFKGFIYGVLDQYRESTIHSMYGHGQVNTKDYRENVYSEPWKFWIEDTSRIEMFLIDQPSVQYIFPRVSFSALLKSNNVSISGSGQGIEAKTESLFFNSLKISEGEILQDQADGVLLGLGLARGLGVGAGDTISLIVNSINGEINEAHLKVVGVFNTGVIDFDNHVFRIQLRKAQSLLKTDRVEFIAIGLRNYQSWDELAAKVESTFPNLDATSFAVLDKVYYQNSVDWLNAQFHVIQFIILAIVLLGIFNSIAAAILERKQEIGNFRANGESVFDIMKLIVIEGVFLGVLGGLLGIGIAYGILKVFLDNQVLLPPGPGTTLPFYVSFLFTWEMVYSTLILTTIAAIIASVLGGLRVARMPIAEALRS